MGTYKVVIKNDAGDVLDSYGDRCPSCASVPSVASNRENLLRRVVANYFRHRHLRQEYRIFARQAIRELRDEMGS